MQDFISYFPTIFCYWTSILIVWSLFSAYGMFLIIGRIKHCGFSVRQSDRTAMWMSLFGGITLAALMFGFPNFVALIIDVMIGIDFWYSLFLAYVGWSSLSGLPVVLNLDNPRGTNRSKIIAYQ